MHLHGYVKMPKLTALTKLYPICVITRQIYHSTESTGMRPQVYSFHINKIFIISNNTTPLVLHSFGSHREVRSLTRKATDTAQGRVLCRSLFSQYLASLRQLGLASYRGVFTRSYGDCDYYHATWCRGPNLTVKLPTQNLSYDLWHAAVLTGRRMNTSEC